MLRPAAALLLLAVITGNALAKDARVGPASLTLPPPPGYCELDTTQPADDRMVKAVEGMLGNTGNRLLAVSADCAQLADWRTGRRPLLDNMAQYQTLIAWENGALPAAPEAVVKEVCGQMHAQGDKLLADMTPDVKARAEQVLKTVQVNEMKFLGVVGEEPLVCYAALLQRMRTEVGTDKTQVVVFATTIVKSKIVYFYLFAPYLSGATVTDMLAQQQAHVRRLHGANPN